VWPSNRCCSPLRAHTVRWSFELYASTHVPSRMLLSRSLVTSWLGRHSGGVCLEPTHLRCSACRGDTVTDRSGAVIGDTVVNVRSWAITAGGPTQEADVREWPHSTHANAQDRPIAAVGEKLIRSAEVELEWPVAMALPWHRLGPSRAIGALRNGATLVERRHHHRLPISTSSQSGMRRLLSTSMLAPNFPSCEEVGPLNASAPTLTSCACPRIHWNIGGARRSLAPA